jgi:pimeloyl-ACP methyl ester carboxylesterase
MVSFALVHGAWHGAWCWEPLRDELTARGHRSLAVDLPCEDPSAGTSDYATVVVEALKSEDDDIVVVGHSLGAATVPLVAQRRAVRSLVYLTPTLPKPGYSIAEALAEETTQGAALSPSDGPLMRLESQQAISLLYNRCPPDVALWAANKLRPQGLKPLTEKSPLERFPSVPSTVILGTEDRLKADVGLMQEVARRRLGVEPIVVVSDHSPFLSMPAELADLLVSCL